MPTESEAISMHDENKNVWGLVIKDSSSPPLHSPIHSLPFIAMLQVQACSPFGDLGFEIQGKCRWQSRTWIWYFC